MRKKAAVILVLFFIVIEVFSSDSIKINNLNNQFENLSYKFESLESSTDRILNALYVTIGFIVASVLGINIWNLVINNRKQNNLIQTQLDDAKKHLDKHAEKKLSEITKNILNSQEKLYKNVIKDIINIRLDKLSSKSKFLESHSTYLNDIDVIVRYIDLAKEKQEYIGYSDYDLKQGLVALQKALESEEYIHHTEIDNLLKKFSSESYSKYQNYTEKIIETLKKK